MIANDRCSYWLSFKMGQFSAFLFSPCLLPLFLFTSLTWQLWRVLAVLLILQYFLPLSLGSCCSSPVYEVFQILLIHCCLHEYYRILLFSSNLSLSLFLNILNIYLLCMCMNCIGTCVPDLHSTYVEGTFRVCSRLPSYGCRGWMNSGQQVSSS